MLEQLIFDKGTKASFLNRENVIFSTNGAGTFGYLFIHELKKLLTHALHLMQKLT